MNPEYATAFQILLVGMLTVFVILSIVVFWGGVLIRVVNRISPQVEAKPGLKPSKSPSSSDSVPSKKIAAISTAVNLATHGQARVIQVSKVS